MDNEVVSVAAPTKLPTRVTVVKQLSELGYLHESSLVETKKESYGLYRAPIGLPICIRISGISISGRTLTKICELNSDDKVGIDVMKEVTEDTIAVWSNKVLLSSTKSEENRFYLTKTSVDSLRIYPVIDATFIIEDPINTLRRVDELCVDAANRIHNRWVLEQKNKAETLRIQYQQQIDLMNTLSYKINASRSEMVEIKAKLKEVLVPSAEGKLNLDRISSYRDELARIALQLSILMRTAD